MPRRRSRLRDSLLARFAVFELAYLVAFRLSVSFTESLAAPFWFPGAILLCALLVTPPGQWWVYLLGTAPIRLLLFIPPDAPSWYPAVCWINDSLEALLVAWLLRDLSRPARWLSDLEGFGKYLLVAVALSPILSAVGGAASDVWLGAGFVNSWRNRFLGDALASLILTPLLVALVSSGRQLASPDRRRMATAALLIAALTLSGYFAFLFAPGGGAYPPFLLYIPVPFLLAAVLVFGVTGASIGLLVLSLMATYATIAGRGPFALGSTESSVVSMQLFFVVVSLPFLFLSVLIEQQRRTDRSLRESERRFRSLVDVAPVMVWMAAPDGRCTFVNKPWVDFTGRRFEDELGDGRVMKIHAEDRERWAGHYQRAAEAGAGFTWEYRLLRWDGVHRWILESGSPRFDAKRMLLGYIGSCVDITDRKEGEDRLRSMSAQLLHAQETERLRIGQELHDDLSQRAAALSIGLSYLARRRDQNVAREFEELQHQAADLCRGIRQVSHQLRPTILDQLGLAAALRDLCVQSTTQVQTVTMVETTPLPALRDEVAIAFYRVAQEGVRNALKHSGAAQVDIELRASGPDVRLSVRDTGRGFAVGSVPLPGLGLSGMRERMRNVGGNLTVQSVPGRGTTILVTLPLELARNVEPAETSRPRAPARRAAEGA
jgi:PAS domain S-box-containing protein